MDHLFFSLFFTLTTLTPNLNKIFCIQNIVEIEHFSDVKLFHLFAVVLQFLHVLTKLKKKSSNQKLNLDKILTPQKLNFKGIIIKTNREKLWNYERFNSLEYRKKYKKNMKLKYTLL